MNGSRELGDGRRGVVASACALSAGELVAALVPSASSPLGGSARAFIDFTPGPVVDVTLALVEGRDKALLLGTLFEGALANGAVAGRMRRGHAPLAAQGALMGAAAGTRHGNAPAPSLAAGVVGGAAGAAVLELLRRARSPRAEALALAGAGAAAGIARAIATRRSRQVEAKRAAVRLPAPARPAAPPPPDLAVEGISPLLTPRERFYVTDTTLPHPRVDPGTWRLRVDGLVEQPAELTLDELLAVGVEEHYATLICVHNPVGGDRLGTARWSGVPLAELLRRAKPDRHATHVRAHSVDGFSADIPLELIADGRPALAVVGMRGEPLPTAHGFPARVLVAGVYGYDANVKWLTRLELIAPADGDRDYWEARGWPDATAHVRPSARIDVPHDAERIAPGPATAAGVAWAPPAGIERVEVSVDGGDWRAAELGPELAPTAWRQWRLDWDATPGTHELRVRAHGRAASQPEEPAPPYPAGSAGVHAVKVTAGDGGPLPSALAGRASAMGRRVTLAARGAKAWRAGA